MDHRSIGIVGVGRIGEVHLRHLVQSGLVSVKYLVDAEAVHPKIKDLINHHRLQDVTVLKTEEVDTLFNDKS